MVNVDRGCHSPGGAGEHLVHICRRQGLDGIDILRERELWSDRTKMPTNALPLHAVHAGPSSPDAVELTWPGLGQRQRGVAVQVPAVDSPAICMIGRSAGSDEISSVAVTVPIATPSNIRIPARLLMAAASR